jgi:hypothetical protein
MAVNFPWILFASRGVVDYDTKEEDKNNVDKDKKSSFKHYHLQLQKSKK